MKARQIDHTPVLDETEKLFWLSEPVEFFPHPNMAETIGVYWTRLVMQTRNGVQPANGRDGHAIPLYEMSGMQVRDFAEVSNG